MGNNVCSVEGCWRETRTSRAVLCNIHYHRAWRTGSPLGRIPKPTIEHSGGYILEHLPNHPLAGPGRYVYQHRRVFYDANGEGPFTCHVCGAPLMFHEMHVDHLDDNPTNNSLSNLAPACPTCNQWRGREKMCKTRRAQGHLLTHGNDTLCLSEWARRIGISPQSLGRRIKNGWTIERAVTEGRGVFGPQSRRCRNAAKSDGPGGQLRLVG